MPRWNRYVTTLFALSLISLQTARAFALDEPLKVEGGLISGAETAVEGVRAFKGVPYAAPPVGELRWKAPQSVKPWSGVKAATDFGPACAQLPDPTMAFVGLKMGPTSEDCLYLNVYTPAKSASERLPVMVWVHGGAFLNGSGALPFYEGSNLAKRGIVVVTINYRLGPFGFFAHPALSKESPHHVSGNYGLLDQIAALKWVQKNIAGFGGDKSRVTLFGESAGSMSVSCLMASPLAKGLFQRGIAESGAAFRMNPNLRVSWYGERPAEQVGEEIAKSLVGDNEKDVLTALRSKSADEILKASNIKTELINGPGNQFGPIVDGYVLPDDPGVIFAAGRQLPVPLIVGTNGDEGTVFANRLHATDPDMYQTMMRKRYGGYGDDVLKMYPASTPTEARASIARALGDDFFAAQARFFATNQSKIANAYLYRFTYIAPNTPFTSLGAFHGSEIIRVFGTGSVLKGIRDDNGVALTDTMMGAWSRFAATGDPNGPGLPTWPKYDASSDGYMEFGSAVEPKSGLLKDQIDLFDKIANEHRAQRTSH